MEEQISQEIGTVNELSNAFEAMLSSEDADSQEQPVETQEVDEPEEAVEATDEEVEEAEDTEDAEPEQDDLSQWLSEVQDSLQDNPELLDALQLKLKVAGEEQEVTFADLKKASMQEADYTKKTQALAEQRKALEAKQREAQKEFDAKVQEASSVSTMLENELVKEYQAVNWEELRQYDPAEWSAKQQEFQLKSQQIQQAKATLAQQVQQHQQENINKQTNEAIQVLTQEIPEWNNPEARANDLKSYRDAAINVFGMREDTVNSVTDPGFIRMIREALTHRKTEEAVKGKAKKLKKLPKFTKPGAKRSTNQAKNTQQKLAQRIKRTGDKRDLAGLLETMI